MDVDQKTLERIAGALERIAKALEALPSTNADAIHNNDIVDAVKTVGSLAAEAIGHGGTLMSSAKAASEKQVHAVVAKAIGVPAKKASATKTAPVPKPDAKKTPTILSKDAKKKMAELRKTPAGQQLCDFFERLGLTILNPGAIAPKVEHPKLANAIWQFRSVAFDLMANINSAMHRKSTYTIDLSEKKNAEIATITSLCDAVKKAKLITYAKHDEVIDISPIDDKTNYMSGKWGEDVILTKTLKVAEFINKQKGKPICSVFKNIEYKKNGSDRWMDSECDVVLALNGKFYFIEVKTGKQLNLVNYVNQVEHLNNKKEFSIFCCIDANSAPSDLQPLREKNNFAIFDFEHFEDALKDLIKKRQNYSFE